MSSMAIQLSGCSDNDCVYKYDEVKVCTYHIGLIKECGEKLSFDQEKLEKKVSDLLGVAFGILQGMNPVFIGLAILASGAIIYYYQQIDKKDWLIRLALMMELGGAIGNLIDRLRLGYVVDFIHVYWQNHHFPAFNIADSAITLGVILLLVDTLFLEKHRQARLNAQG